MALSMVLSAAGFPPRRIKTSALVHISPSADGFSIPRIELVTEGDVPGIDLAAFTAHAETAKLGCPVSRSEEHTSELQSLMRISYAVFCLKNKSHTEKESIILRVPAYTTLS